MSQELKKSVTYVYGEEQILENLEQRKIVVNQDIDSMIIEEAVLHILKWNKEDKEIPIEERKPIIVYVNSLGGSVGDGFSLCDVIVNSKTPVYTVNIGMAYSMGFLIAIAGHKRYGLPTSTYLLHDGSSVMYNSMSKLNDTAIFYKELETKIKNYVLSHSNLSSKMYDKKYGAEWYMFSEEAKKNGFVDFVIGQNCDLDEII